MSRTVVTGEGRFSFPSLFEPREPDNEGDKPKYEVTLLIPKSDKETIKKLKTAIKEAAEEGKTSKFGGKIPANLKTPLHDGDDKADDYPEFTDHYYFAARSTKRPGIVDKNLNAVIDGELVYPGVYGRLQVEAFAYNHPKGGKGVALSLQNAQVLKDGEPFGSVAQRAEEAFNDGFSTNSDDDDDIDDDDDELL